MARVERRHMGCVRAWRVCESHGLCDGMARVERRRTWAVCVGKGRVLYCITNTTNETTPILLHYPLSFNSCI